LIVGVWQGFLFRAGQLTSWCTVRANCFRTVRDGSPRYHRSWMLSHSAATFSRLPLRAAYGEAQETFGW